MKHPVVWFEVLGEDGAKLQRFYGELFGWKIDANNAMKYGMVEAQAGGMQGIPGGVGGTYAGMRPMVTFYVETPEIGKTLAEAQRLGAKVVLPRKELPAGPPIALFQDPEGHLIGLVEHMAAA